MFYEFNEQVMLQTWNILCCIVLKCLICCRRTLRPCNYRKCVPRLVIVSVNRYNYAIDQKSAQQQAPLFHVSTNSAGPKLAPAGRPTGAARQTSPASRGNLSPSLTRNRPTHEMHQQQWGAEWLCAVFMLIVTVRCESACSPPERGRGW